MLKSILRLIISLTVITILATGALYLYNKGRTYYNEDDAIGNTAGNIYNGGLFCEIDGKIFFSNDKANGALYVMNSDLSNIRMLRSDKAVFINVDDNYIYYVQANDTRSSNLDHMMFYNSGVVRIKRNGTSPLVYTTSPSSYLTLKGNTLYFQRYDAGTGYRLYKFQIDGENERPLLKDKAIPVHVTDDSLYYTLLADDRNIYRLDLKSFLSYQAYEGSYLYPIFKNDYIYFIDMADDNKIYRMNTDGSDKELLVDSRCSTYNITNSGIYLYYQVDDNKNNGLYRLNLKTMESVKLTEGDFKQLNVTEKYVFFRDYDSSNTYIISADGIAEVNVFDPASYSSNSR